MIRDFHWWTYIIISVTVRVNAHKYIKSNKPQCVAELYETVFNRFIIPITNLLSFITSAMVKYCSHCNSFATVNASKCTELMFSCILYPTSIFGFFDKSCKTCLYWLPHHKPLHWAIDLQSVTFHEGIKLSSPSCTISCWFTPMDNLSLCGTLTRYLLQHDTWNKDVKVV